MNQKGINKRVESAKLTSLFPSQELRLKSLDKTITRHFSNLCLSLPQTEYCLYNWLIFMSDINCTFEYSTKLMDQFKKAADRFNEINKTKVTYNTGLDRARDSFISLVEKGYLIRLEGNKFMFNPMVVARTTSGLNRRKLQKEYLAIIDSAENVEQELSKWCNDLISK